MLESVDGRGSGSPDVLSLQLDRTQQFQLGQDYPRQRGPEGEYRNFGFTVFVTVDMDPRYWKQPPWHDAAVELRGPVVADVLELFAERWNDPHPLDHRSPYRMLLQRLADMPRHPEPLPETAPPPPPAGPHAVQLLRTYGVKHPPFPFSNRTPN